MKKHQKGAHKPKSKVPRKGAKKTGGGSMQKPTMKYQGRKAR